MKTLLWVCYVIKQDYPCQLNHYHIKKCRNYQVLEPLLVHINTKEQCQPHHEKKKNYKRGLAQHICN